MIERNDVYYFRKLVAKAAPGAGGCWVWQAAKNKDGYSSTSYRGKQVSGHILIMKLLGLYVEGLYVDHTCMVKHCINPQHLRMATPRTNALENNPRNPAAINAKKKHCKYGHAFDKANTAFNYNGRGTKERICKQCRRDVAKRRRLKRGAKSVEFKDDLVKLKSFGLNYEN